MDTGTDLVTLIDDDDVEHQFEMADYAEIDGQPYAALIPVFDQPADLLEDSGELVVLKVVLDEKGEECLETIEDEAEFDKVSDVFMERLSDVFEFEQDDE